MVATAPAVSNFYADQSDSLAQLLLEPECLPATCFPLVIRGKSSVAKTLVALATLQRLVENLNSQAEINTNNQPTQVCTFTADDFCRRHSLAMQDQSLDEFKCLFRSADVLMIDDVHQACRFPHAQKELGRIIDDRNENEQPTLLVLRDDAEEFARLDPFLASRIHGGLNIKIRRPGFAARSRLVESIAVQLKLGLNVAQIESLARLARVNVVQLKTILTFIGPALSKQKEPLGSVADISRLFGLPANVIDLLAAKVLEKVASDFEISLSAMCGRKRSSSIVAARGMVIVLLRNHFDISWNRIGQLLGGRDHSTVINAFKKTTKLIASDQTASHKYKRFSRKILLAQLEYSENHPYQF